MYLCVLSLLSLPIYYFNTAEISYMYMYMHVFFMSTL